LSLKNMYGRAVNFSQPLWILRIPLRTLISPYMCGRRSGGLNPGDN